MTANEVDPQGTNTGAMSKLIAYIFATIFTFVGLLFASYQFFYYPFLELIIRKGPDASGDAVIGSQVAMFGMLIFGFGFSLLLTQIFTESYTVKWKGMTFAGTLAAVLIFMLIVQQFLVNPFDENQRLKLIDDQTAEIITLQETNSTLSKNLVTELDNVSILTSNYLKPKDLSLSIECERSDQSQSSTAGHRVQLLAVSSDPSPRGRARILEIVKLVGEIEKDLPENERTLVSRNLRNSRFIQIVDADILFVPKIHSNGISFFVPGLLSVSDPDVQIRLINADLSDGSVPISNPNYSDLLLLEIKNPSDLNHERQEIGAVLRFAALAEFCKVDGNEGDI